MGWPGPQLNYVGLFHPQVTPFLTPGEKCGLGASQALGSLLPSTLDLNIPGYGPLDIGAKAGKEGIKDRKSIIDEQNSDVIPDNPAAKIGFGARQSRATLGNSAPSEVTRLE
jgi:hypothetical protein